MGRNNDAGQPLLHGCGNYSVIVNPGTSYSEYQDGSGKLRCFYPGVHGLDNIARHYPNSTILHIPGDANEWVGSARSHFQLLDRLSKNCDGFPTPKLISSNSSSILSNMTVSDEEWVLWYNNFTEKIRAFAMQHSSLSYIEGKSWDDPGTSVLLEEATGIPSSQCYQTF